MKVPKVRILIIEDNPDIAANIGDYLDEKGHTVDFAGDGITGLHLAIVNDFDAIVLDLALPGMDGLDVLKQLRIEKPRLPVVILTTSEAEWDRLKAYERHMNGYIVKPFDFDSFAVLLDVITLLMRDKNHPCVLFWSLGNESGYGLGYFGAVIAAQLVLGILASVIVMWVSRQREFRADAGSAKLNGREPMIRALQRLESNVPSQLPQEMQAFGISGARSGMMKLFLSHPPIPERIAALQRS